MAHFNFVALQHALSTIPISSSECEWGFSQMNLIATPCRASLLTKIISSLLFVRLVGPPLKLFDPTKYVDSWILRGRRSAIDRHCETLRPKTAWLKFGAFYSKYAYRKIFFYKKSTDYHIHKTWQCAHIHD